MTLPKNAIVMPPPDSFAIALTRDADPRPVDVALAKQQHEGYVAALRTIGLNVIELPAQDEYPDSCFVQDPAMVIDGICVVTRMGADSRKHEGKVLVAALEPFALPKYSITKPGTIEGGDVFATDDSIYVGLSERTNEQAISQLRNVFSERKVVAVPVPGRFLHLVTGCSYLGEMRLLTTAECAVVPELAAFEKLIVPEEEWPASNVLAVGKDVIAPSGYPKTADMLDKAGYRVHTVPLTEFEKRDGSVTCLSLLF